MRLELWELETDAGAGGSGDGGAPAGGGADGGGAPAGGSDEGGGAPAGSDTWSPSRDEWETVVGGLGYIAQKLFAEEGDESGDEGGEEPDLTDPKVLAQVVQRYVDERTGQVAEMAAPAVRAEGERRLKELFNGFAKNPEIGDFDQNLAQRLSEAMWQPGQDPVKVAEQAAREAARIRKEERTAGEENFRKTLNGPGQDDLGGGGAATRRAPDAKTYDEVIAKWTGDEEV